LRRCGVAALRRCGVAALRRCGVAALRPHCPIAGSIVCSPSSVCKAWPCGPPPLAAAGLTDRWREAARSAHAINAGMSMTAPMTRLSSPAPRPPPESRSRGIIQVGLATPTSLRPKRAPLRGRSMTFWKIRCRRQPSAPTHMPAKKCGFRPAFTALPLWRSKRLAIYEKAEPPSSTGRYSLARRRIYETGALSAGPGIPGILRIYRRPSIGDDGDETGRSVP
jgi:hypothetical protein